MKNWLVALLGVSLVAITYTAYELELKKPATAPSVQPLAASGEALVPQQPAASPPAVKSRSAATGNSEGMAENPAEKVAGAGTDAANAGKSQPAVEHVTKIDGAEDPGPMVVETPLVPGPGAKDAGAAAGNGVVETAQDPVREEKQPVGSEADKTPASPGGGSPSLVDKAMQTVASLLKGADGAGGAEKAGEASPAGQSEPSALSKAVETVRKLVIGPDENEVTKPAGETGEPGAEDLAARDVAGPPGTKSDEGVAKGLIGRAVDAVAELVTPQIQTDNPGSEGAGAARSTRNSTSNSTGISSSPSSAAKPAAEIVVAAKPPEPEPATPLSTVAAKPEKTPEQADGPVAPSFDVVRVERDGSAVIAGRAEPGTEIKLSAGGKVLGTATASRRGEFVIIPDKPIPAGSSALALESRSDDGRVTASKQVVTIALPDPNAPAPAEMAPVTAPAPVVVAETVTEKQKIITGPSPADPAAGTSETALSASTSASAGETKPDIGTNQAKPAEVANQMPATRIAAGKPPAPVVEQDAEISTNVSPDKSDGIAAGQSAIIVTADTGPATEKSVGQAMTAADMESSKGNKPVVKADPVNSAEPRIAMTTPATPEIPAPTPAAPAASPLAATPQAPSPEAEASQSVTPEAVTPEAKAPVAPAPALKTPPTASSDTAVTPVRQSEAKKLSEPLVIVSQAGAPSRVLQGGSPKPKTPVTFETVDYDDAGQVILAGQVAPGADVRAYLGAAHLGDARAGPDGQWVLRATRQIEPGQYQLRVDKIDAGGKVLARVTAPFERAAPDAIARVRADGEVIIQPGDNLWNISRMLYGSGTQYTVIYDANRNQISRPELIFPGQVFMTPGGRRPNEAEAIGG